MFITIEGALQNTHTIKQPPKPEPKKHLHQSDIAHGVCAYHYAFVLACFSRYTGI